MFIKGCVNLKPNVPLLFSSQVVVLSLWRVTSEKIRQRRVKSILSQLLSFLSLWKLRFVLSESVSVKQTFRKPRTRNFFDKKNLWKQCALNHGFQSPKDSYKWNLICSTCNDIFDRLNPISVFLVTEYIIFKKLYI